MQEFNSNKKNDDKTKEIEIIINAKKITTTKKVLTYWELIELAFNNPSQSENICYTIVYRRGPNANKEGSLVEGQEVKIKKGMRFDVAATDKS